MISALLYAFERGAGYVRAHPQILFSFVLVIVLPIIFLYSSNAFLAVGQANQDRLQKDKIGLLHDSVVSILEATNFDASIAQRELTRLSETNPDIKKFRIARSVPGSTAIEIVAAKDVELVGTTEAEGELYRTSLTRPDESIIIPFVVDGHRLWQTFRAVPRMTGETYFIFTETDLYGVDSLFAQRKINAYLGLALLYALLLAIAFWLIKITDYRYLFAEAEKSNQTKDLFTNMIAHELRAPLTAIKGYASMAREEARDPELLKYTERIEISTERLLTIVNDLLDVARIQSGKLSVTNEKFALVPIVSAVLDELRISAAEKQITLVQEEADDQIQVLADEKRTHQVLTNLLSNAIKYTKEGTITVSLEEKGEMVELRVKDTGLGIAAEDQQKLFAPFFRVASTDVSQITGTGLGMWITRQMIELMGGSVAVESIKGVGTHVVVHFKKAK